LPPAFTLVSCSAYFFDPEHGGDMFLRNVGWHSCRPLSRWFLVQLIFFDPEDGGDMFLRNIGWHSCRLLSRWFLAQLIFSTLKIEAICSSETSLNTQRTTRRVIPEDGTLHNHRCENLKCYICNLPSAEPTASDLQINVTSWRIISNRVTTRNRGKCAFQTLISPPASVPPICNMSSLPAAAVLLNVKGKLLSLTLKTGACKYLHKLRHSVRNKIHFKAMELRP
jgi:hypothetical protein